VLQVFALPTGTQRLITCSTLTHSECQYLATCQALMGLKPLHGKLKGLANMCWKPCAKKHLYLHPVKTYSKRDGQTRNESLCIDNPDSNLRVL